MTATPSHEASPSGAGHPQPGRALCVSIHAVAPSHWPACARLVAATRAVAPVPITLLVVPDFHERDARVPAEFRRALDAYLASGHELALQGLHHRDDSPPPVALADILRRRLHGRGEGEFAALPELEARARLIRGREWFRRHAWPLWGFVPPAGLLSQGAARAVRTLGFRYTTSVGAFHALAPARTVRAPCIAWGARGGATRHLAMAWNETVARAARSAQVWRLALHPADAAHRDVLRQAQRLLEAALLERTPLTKVALADALRAAYDPRSAARAPSSPERHSVPARAPG